MATGLLPELHNGIVTSWIPLTTPAPSPYPSSCLSALRLEMVSSTVTNLVAFDPWYGQAVDTDFQNCLPAEQTQWWAQEKAPTTVLNIGPFACPTPYTTATVVSEAPGTTLVACCPSGYAYQGTILPPLSGRQCFSALTSGQVITAKAGSIGPNIFSDTTATITATDVGIYGNQLNGYIFGDALAAPTPVGNSNQTAIAIATTTSTTATSEPSHHTPTPVILSPRVKVGVGIAIAVGVVAICCFVTLVWIMRRRAAAATSKPASDEHRLDEKPLPYTPRPPSPPLQEMSGEKEYFEVEANERRAKSPIEMWA